jgi:hypothetical protein
MTPHPSKSSSARSESSSANTDDFSLFVGGPIYQMLLRVGLVRPPLDRVGLRMLIITTLAWAPLLVLTILDGRFLSGVKVPFLFDYEVHLRLLAALPLLIAAEVVIHRRVKVILRQFHDRQIVTSAVEPQFETIIQSAIRLRNSAGIELSMVAAVILAAALSWRATAGLHSDTWLATMTSGVALNTPAGYWYQLVSIPIGQFIALRWYFRLCVWARLLWQTSKLDLNLVATHPDRACGLGFLDGMIVAMGPLLLAHSCLLSGNLANRILHDGTKLPDHYPEIAAMAVFLVLLALGPLCVFTPRLVLAKRQGLLNYGRLASDYVVGFDKKWIAGQRSPDEPLLGSDDIQSLADIGNSFHVVQSIVPFAFGRASLTGLAVIIALPLLPLTLTMFSLQELAVRLLKILL